MTPDKFYGFLIKNLKFPFNIDDVTEIEENTGTIWIDTEDVTYSINIIRVYGEEDTVI